MEFRLAKFDDLPELKRMYRKIVADMKMRGIHIWDDVYPAEFLSDDIERDRLYVLAEENGDLVSALALCDESDGKNSVKWQDATARALYIYRFGVNADYGRRGIGGVTLRHAISHAREMGADFLRLFVVDSNCPAISLYLKNGFQMADGLFEHQIDEGCVLREYGLEIKVSDHA